MSDLNTQWARAIVWYTDGFFDNEPIVPPFKDEDLVQYLTGFGDPECDVQTCIGRECPAKKSAVCWSPAQYLTGATRDDDNVLALNYAVFDLDHLVPGQLDAVRLRLDDPSTGGLEYVLHSTHSHAPGDECYRLVMPVTRPITPDEWPLIRPAVIKALDLPADESTKDLSRLYAGPTQRTGVEPFAAHRRGAPLDVDEALEVARQMGLGAPPRFATTPSPAPITPDAAGPAMPATIDLDALRESLAKVRRSKANGGEYQREQAALLAKVLDGESLAPIGKRHNARIRVTGMIAKWVPPRTPWEAVLELMRPCLVATDLDDNETFETAVEKTRKLYEGSMVWRLEDDAKMAAAKAQVRQLADKVKGTVIPRPEDVDEPGDPDAWMKLLLMTDGGNVRGCEHNAVLLLSCHPDLRGTIRWNDVSKKIEIVGGPLAGVSNDVLDSAAAAWLQRQCSFMGGAKIMRLALLQVARDNTYDPIADYLMELGWDGTDRIDTFLERYCGAVATDEQQLRYVRAVSRRWMISLVARALRPGCKVDTVLILEGEQGVGKSTALEAIVGSQYFLDTSITVGEKDAMQAIAATWLVELGELASLRRAETDKIKQFISSKIDKFRPPYGADIVESPRRCIIAGSCNPEGGYSYLKDASGNRRFWPVRVAGKTDVEGIVRDRDLILAEAVKAFRDGERWHLIDDEVELAARETEDRLETSPIGEAVIAWWYGMKPGRRPRLLTLGEIAQGSLGVDAVGITHAIRVEIGRVMSDMGFEVVRKRKGAGERGRYYEATDELVRAPERTPAMRAAGMTLMDKIKASDKDGGR